MQVLTKEATWGFPALQEVFASFFELAIEPQAEAAWRGPTLQAYVSLAGARRYSVVLVCAPELGNLIAARMFGCEQSCVSDDERLDAMGETANVLAGRIKASLAPDASIGLPAICAPGEGLLHVAGGRICSAINASAGGGSLSVVVFEEAGA